MYKGDEQEGKERILDFLEVSCPSSAQRRQALFSLTKVSSIFITNFETRQDHSSSELSCLFLPLNLICAPSVCSLSESFCHWSGCLYLHGFVLCKSASSFDIPSTSLSLAAQEASSKHRRHDGQNLPFFLLALRGLLRLGVGIVCVDLA